MSIDKTEQLILEERKVKALEKIGNGVSDLVFWLEEIDKEGWDERIQYYLSTFAKLVPETTEDES